MKKIGRPKGSKNPIKDKPLISITSVTLNPAISFGKQLKQFRKAKGLSLMEMDKLTGTSYSNISHFENGDPVVGNSISNAIRYCKALGIKQIKINIQ